MAEDQDQFAEEAKRLRASGVLGESGRLVELFDFLAGRGPDAEPASQAEIAEAVFGTGGGDSDDATVRVYIHRLRKRLEEYYASDAGKRSAGQLALPSGTYALRYQLSVPQLVDSRGEKSRWPWIVGVLLALLACLSLAWALRPGNPSAEANALWQPFLDSDRPITLAVGDYYMFGEIDPLAPESGRLIRDFTVNSPTDLARAQEADPSRYGRAEDMGLKYLPLSSAFALSELMPILGQHEGGVQVIPASELTGDSLRKSNVVYVGLVSGMGLLENVNFAGSGFTIGRSYDELIDQSSRRSYVSEEAQSLPSSRYYRDYGYVSAFEAPGGALVAVVAGARDTGLRGLAQSISGPSLPGELEELAAGETEKGFEALFEITGQQGADMNDRLVVSRVRPGS